MLIRRQNNNNLTCRSMEIESINPKFTQKQIAK